MHKIFINEVKSTNSLLLKEMAEGKDYAECTVLYTLRQTAGRGQVGNTWESENDKNIAFSLLLKPDFLPIRDQFIISEITSLAIVDTLKVFGLNNVSIKWPNDIYVDDEKICGMLIENSLMGSKINYSVIGVGININQEKWVGNAPNPTSIKLKTGQEISPIDVLDKVINTITDNYRMLQSGLEVIIHSRYIKNIYRKDGYHPYKDAESGREFMAKIKTIEPSGYLQLEDTEGSTYRYMFKEVKFVLPCGVTKE